MRSEIIIEINLELQSINRNHQQGVGATTVAAAMIERQLPRTKRAEIRPDQRT